MPLPEYSARHARAAGAASRRADRLLLRCLTPAQRRTFEAHKYFDVTKGDRTYRIHHGSHGNVRLLKGDKEVMSYCAQPSGVPIGDVVLAQKLMLDANEAEFLRIANARPLC